MKNIKRAIAGVVLAGAAISGVVGVAAPANATPNSAVCDGIEDHLAAGDGYLGYLVEAFLMGQSMNYDVHAQARNIVESVVTYCPQYGPGIRSAAAQL